MKKFLAAAAVLFLSGIGLAKHDMGTDFFVFRGGLGTTFEDFFCQPLPQVSSTAQARIVCDSADMTLKQSLNGGAFTAIGSGGGAGYSTIQDETVPLVSRPTVNFAGAGVTCVDNPGLGRTDCTVPSGGSPTFSVIATGTNVAATMTVGTGATLTPNGSGVVRASDLVCTSGGSPNKCVDGTEINLTGGDALGQVPVFDGTNWTVIGPGTTGQFIGGNTGSTPSFKSVSFANLGPGTNVGNALVVGNGGALSTSGTGTIAATTANSATTATLAATATALAANGGNCAVPQAAAGVDASGVAEGCFLPVSVVQDEGTTLTQRSTMNFIGSGINCMDNAGKTECNVPAAVSTSAPNTWSAVQTFNAGDFCDAGSEVFNVKCATFAGGAVGDGTTNDTAAILAAAAAMPAAGATLYFPAGTYLVSDTGAKGCALPILNQQMVVRGAGAGATTLETLTSGSGYDILCSVSGKTCGAGAGACDAVLGTSGRGAGCVCMVNADCTGANCGSGGGSAGSTKRYGMIQDLRLLNRAGNSTGVDLSGLTGWTLQNLFFSSSVNPGTNVLFADASASPGIGGYDNTLLTSTIQGGSPCVRFYSTSNDNRVVSSTISNCTGNGVTVDSGANTSMIEGTLFQANGSGTIDLDDAGSNGRYFFNRFEENSAATMIQLETTAKDPQVVSNYFQGTATQIFDKGAVRPTILETNSGDNAGTRTDTDQVRFPRPPWTPRGLVDVGGVQQWTWQARDATTTTLDAIGMAAPTITGTASSSTGGTGHYVGYLSGAVSGNVGGLTPAGGVYNAFAFQEKPNLSASFRSDVTNVRVWVGLFSGDPTASSTPAVSYVAFRFDDSLDGTTWHACSDNGSGTPTCIDTGITAASAPRMNFMIQTGGVNTSSVTSVAYFSDGKLVGLLCNSGFCTTNGLNGSGAPMPAAATTLHVVATTTTRTTAGKSMLIGRITATSPNVGG